MRYVTSYEVFEGTVKNWQGNPARTSFSSGSDIELSHDRFPEPQKKRDYILEQDLSGDPMIYYKGEPVKVRNSETGAIEFVDIHQLDIMPGTEALKNYKKGDKLKVYDVDKIDIPPDPDFFGNVSFQRQLQREASFKALGLDEFGEHTLEDVKAAYKKMSLTYHPDRNPGDEAAVERFKAVQEAWEFLDNHGVVESDFSVNPSDEQSRQKSI